MEERNLTCIGCPLGCALKASDTNCDKYSLCEKWHNTDGIRKDGTGYSKGKDNGCDGVYQPNHGRGTGAYR